MCTDNNQSYKRSKYPSVQITSYPSNHLLLKPSSPSINRWFVHLARLMSKSFRLTHDLHYFLLYIQHSYSFKHPSLKASTLFINILHSIFSVSIMSYKYIFAFSLLPVHKAYKDFQISYSDYNWENETNWLCCTASWYFYYLWPIKTIPKLFHV